MKAFDRIYKIIQDLSCKSCQSCTSCLTVLRIAFATPEFVTENHFDGGLANYLNRVTKTLAQLGHDVHIVTSQQKMKMNLTTKA